MDTGKYVIGFYIGLAICAAVIAGLVFTVGFAAVEGLADLIPTLPLP